jgi:hypothetical protein
MTSLFPGCGPDCLKEKKLKALKAAMDADPKNKQAKTDYYTALNGPEWLQSKKDKAAKRHVEPVLTGYRSQYDGLNAQLQSQSQFSDLAQSLKSDGGMPYLEKDYEEEKSKADVLNRLWILSGKPNTHVTDFFGLFLNILIFVLGAVVVWVGYMKYKKHTAPPPSFIGGNRLRKN